MNLMVGIFARAGSKGFPNKNLVKMNGDTLASKAIRQAVAMVGNEKVYISTDSSEISEIGRILQVKVPFVRPAELATDQSPELDSWKHLLKYVKEELVALPEVMIVLPLTSPLRRDVDIQGALDIFLSQDCDLVISINKSRKNPYFNMVERKSDGYLAVSKLSPDRASRRQDAPNVWEINNAIYIAKTKYILQTRDILSGNVLGYEMPVEFSLDIDDENDVEYLKYLESRGLV
jgi:CMP-N-acetylneuraminic acid synthetase